MKTSMTFPQSLMKLCQLWSLTSVTVILDLLNIYLPVVCTFLCCMMADACMPPVLEPIHPSIPSPFPIICG